MALGRAEEALASYDRALAVKPDNPEALNNRGDALKNLGRLEEAVASYDEAVTLKPDYADAHYKRGNALMKLGRAQKALASYVKALEIEPRRFEALNNCGVALISLGRAQEALASYDRVLAIKPDFLDAHNNRGVLLMDLGRAQEALASYDRALAIKPDYIDALNNRGNALRDLGRPEEALAMCDQALAIKPDFAEALNTRGAVLRQLKRPEEALASYGKSLAIKPDYPEAHNNRGNALRDLGRLEEAVASYERALALKPNYPEAHNNRGNALKDLGHLDEAMASYDKALAVKPSYDEAACNRGLLFLLLGKLESGWLDYERRWNRGNGARRKLIAPYPFWKGEDLSGKRIIVYEEQGFGDVIQFSRYLNKLSERGAQVAFLARPSLHRLLKSFTPQIRLIDDHPANEPFDYQSALLSLPTAFRTTLDTIPADGPYLRPEPALAAKWRDRVGGHGLKVGICWQGNPTSKVDVGRSIPLRCFKALSAIPHVRLISLQKNYGLDQLAELGADLKIETLGPEFDAGADAFIDTAAVMSCLDLIVTSDTSIAHLAGALGRPAWAGLQWMPDWRWLLDRADSPWYPTMTLYRQKRMGDWDGVFERMAGDLARLSRGVGTKGAALADSIKAPIQPDSADTLHNRGNELMALGRAQEALASYDKALAIKPDNATALNNRGSALMQLRRAKEALANFDKALAIRPDYAVALNNRCAALMALKRPEEALASSDKALTIKPDYAEALNNRGDALRALGRLEEAVASIDKALAVKPNYAGALNNRGAALMELNRFAEALASYDRALAIEPNYAGAFYNRAAALLELGRFGEALASFDSALAIKPDYVEALYNRGIALADQKRFQEARLSYDKALAIKPDYAEAAFNRGLLALLLGDFSQGWIGYEKRWDRRESQKRSLLAPYPAWKGEDVSGKRIIVYEEQGFGDVIQFCRYLAGLSKLGAQVTFLVRRSLHRLLNPFAPAIRLTDEPPAGAAFDYQCALLSLPAAFKTTRETVPAEIPYLRSEPELVAKWREKIGSHGLKVGVCWQGNPLIKVDRGRSIPLQYFGALSAIQNVRLISLQRRHGLEQLAELGAKLRIEALGADFDAGADAFIDTAAAMSCLDLIITSDTAIAHLAGALGRPVWLALKWAPEWRWMLDRADSPWYPTMTLYRQKKMGDWGGVFEHMAEDLAKLGQGAGTKGVTKGAIKVPTESDGADAPFKRGNELMALGRFEEASASFDKALAIRPGFVDALINRGVALMQLKRFEEALSSYDHALAVKPGFAGALNNRGAALKNLGRHEEALASFDRVLAVEPNHAGAHFNRGDALMALKRPNEALASYDKALTITPNRADALYNRGNALVALARPEEALANYDKALAIEPGRADTLLNRGNALMKLGRLAEALASYDETLAIKPDYAEPLYNQGIVALLSGDFPQGWIGYEKRWDLWDAAKRRLIVPYPAWRGEDLSGKRIIVYEEQGLGDIIQFSRYLAELSRLGAEVAFFVRPSLHRLLKAFLPAIRLTSQKPQGEDFDYQCALLSLPGALGTTLDTIPVEIPYLRPEAELIAKWRERIGGDGLKVGICWQGDPSGKIDVGRSMPLRYFGALSAIPHARLISLQRRHGLNQLAELGAELRVETLGADFDVGADAFIDTAAAMSCLDLIVTSDTAIAHLAGALGHPVWLALKQTPDWRWLLDRADSPWYPTMTLYRQNRMGDWGGVFERMAEDLVKLSGGVAIKEATIPDYGDALPHNRANELMALGHLEEALASYDKALAIKPDNATALNNRGSALMNLERAEEALASYDKALATKPDYAVALNNRCAALMELKRPEEALASSDGALAVKPNYAEALNNRSHVLMALGRHEEALASIDKALAIKPDYVGALNNRGATLMELGRPEEALASYDAALEIQPNYAGALYNRGDTLMALGRAEEALGIYEKVLAIQPGNAGALNNRGSALMKLKRSEEALASYNEALAIKPDYAVALNNRSAALMAFGRHEEALASSDKALEIKPDYVDGFNNRADALLALGRHEDALASSDKALAIEPNNAGALNNRGAALMELSRPAEALASYDHALAIQPDYAGAHYNRGAALLELRRFDDALASYDHALAIQPNYAGALLNRALLMFLLGDFLRGWSGYEKRWDIRDAPKRRLIAPYPMWKGEDVSGKRIIVYEEQGYGDVIHFSRYLKELSRLGAQVTFLGRPSLHRLLNAFLPAVRMISRDPEGEDFDYQCALMSLPGAFATALDSVPAEIPYLRSEPEMVAKWWERIGGHGLRVGVCWQGNPVGKIDRGRSIPLRCFGALSAIPHTRLISLQKNHGLDQLAELGATLKIETLGSDFDAGADAFIDTAAVMSCLDLVVTSDTAIAHLAGALGRPVWLALKQTPEWRWMLDRVDSPWYPTMTLYRQKMMGDWDGVFERMAEDLAKLSRGAGTTGAAPVVFA